jgi:urocanate hydratase
VTPKHEEDEQGVAVRMTNKAGKPVTYLNKKKSAPRVIAATGQHVGSYRPDLKEPAMTCAGLAAAAVYRARAEKAAE